MNHGSGESSSPAAVKQKGDTSTHTTTPKGFVVVGGGVPPVTPKNKVTSHARIRTHAQAHEVTAETQDESSTTEALLDRISTLPDAEKKALLDRIALSLQAPVGSGDRDLQMWCTAVAEAWDDTVQTPVGLMLVRKAFAAKAVWSPIADLLASAGVDRFQVRERQSFFDLLAALLLEHGVYIAKRAGVPLSVKLLVNASGNLAGLLENAFPGYLAAGMLPMVVKQLCAAR